MPRSDSVKGEEGSNDELFFGFVYASEEGVRAETGFGAEGDPASPGAVPLFVRFFLLRSKDDSVICSA